MNKKTKVFSALCLGVSMMGWAQNADEKEAALEQLDEVVISDSRFALKRENSGKTVIKISKEQIERNQGRSVAQLINAQSGFEITGSRSNAGQNLGVSVRGGRNRQVLVLIDGIQVNDPSQLSGEYDFRLLNLNQIESIEIIKGAASTLYGSGAATAVINITSKKAAPKDIQAVFTSSLGTNQAEFEQDYDIASFDNTVALNGTLDKFTYRTSFSHQFSDGVSAALSDANEKETYSKYALDLNLGYKFSKAFSVNVYGNYTDLDAEIDGFDANSSLVDTDDSFTNSQTRVGIASKYDYENGSVNLNAAYSKYEREFFASFASVFESENYIIDAYNKYVFNDTYYTIVGLNVLDNRSVFAETQSFTSVDPYANVVYVSEYGLNFNLGGRLNNHSEYGTFFTYNINPSYTFNKTEAGYVKVFGSYSTSFIAPSLPQLFGFFGPNPDLEPEENITIEGGVEYKLNAKYRVSGLFFTRDEENTVQFINSGYLNAEEDLTARGVEVEFTAQPLEKLSITANYTFTEYKDTAAPRIPKHKGNLELGYAFTDATFASLTYQYTGERFENSFTPDLEDFNLFNFYGSHSLKDSPLKVFVAVDNILNEDYQDVPGFVSLGRNARIGIQLTF